MYDKGVAYSKVILGLGYAGFFTAWAATRQQLTPKQLFWSALLMLISVYAYVLFEVASMLYQSWVLIILFFKARKGQHIAALAEYEKVSKSSGQVLLVVIWVIVLLLCIPTGIAAAVILGWAFVQRLLALH